MKASKFFMLKRKREELNRQQVVEASATETDISTQTELPQAETATELQKVEEIVEKPTVEVKKPTVQKKKA